MGTLFSSSIGWLKSKEEKGKEILKKAIAFHGGDAYEDKEFGFTFRKGFYSFVHFSDGRYVYRSTKTNKIGEKVEVFMTNGDFSYQVDGVVKELDAKKENGVKNGLNSVVYFASIPYKLQDQSVLVEYVRKIKIKGKTYDEIEIRFKEEGGGDDHDDVFRYWVNRKTDKIDYLAYVYHTGKGGVRFRSAYNDRRVGGVLFQDYENFKADKATPLDDLPTLYEQGSLELLSKIESEKVMVME